MAHPHYSASLEGLEAQDSESDLLDDLELQEILLNSLADTTEDTPERRLEIRGQIREIKTKLKELRSLRAAPPEGTTTL
jgi:hypothetical protein